MKYLKQIILSILLIPTLVFSHGPSRQKVVEDIEINASPDKVWGIIKEFCSIQDWHPGIKSCTADKGSEIESVRTIELENGEKIKEKLYKLDTKNKKIQYAMLKLEGGRVVKDLPIATHGATITVSENGSGSKVQWKGAFYRSFPGQQPPPELSDVACIEAVTKLYKTGLENIKALAEK
ncbi:MAG: SRPBCC family protein [Proteobacteria bacterium]|nr:SRPBCC family protein [Pseudomonadota bacterium]